MVKQTIRIYCRIKPSKQSGIYDVEADENENPKLSFNVPRDLADGFVNNKRETYSFRFDHIFDQKTKQDEIFHTVAKETVDSVLSGYNGTIFAYGQTGSGKTFTITGGAERYVDRGIIPRTLSYVFEQYEKVPSHVFTTHISYLEIYNENGYDLLDPKHEAAKLEDLPKVTLLEDNEGNIHLKNLSLHGAGNEEDALNLLFLGDTNRMIAETPMNQASTRSHCIFTIHVTARETGSASIRRSKLHLVDLAGSERVGKTGVGGTLLTEAKYINLSLHFLEQVIIALSEKSRSHIPYRNSMMTSVLRDSLGGNCMTSMIATCSVEKKNIDESISTCRFAQRVALIKNDALLNEEIDPKLMIARLKREIQELKDELAMATGQEYEGELSDEDKERLKSMVTAYVGDQDPEAALSVGADMRKITYCFWLLKEHAMGKSARPSQSFPSDVSTVQSVPSSSAEDTTYLADKNETQKLKDLIRQRDNEINILVSMLKKEKQNAKEAETRLSSLTSSHEQGTRSVGQSSMQVSTGNDMDVRKFSASSTGSEDRPRSGRRSRNALLDSLSNKQKAMSAGRQEAFEIFSRDYGDNKAIEENKRLLKQKYGEAKSLGEQVNRSRQSINSMKSKLEQNRMRRSVQENVTGSSDGFSQLDAEENDIKSALDEEKSRYRDAFNQLKHLKTEIEHLQHLLEKSKVKLQKDFEFWWSEQAARTADEKNDVQQVKAAWRTPPTSPAELAKGKGSGAYLANMEQGTRREVDRKVLPPSRLSDSSSTTRTKLAKDSASRDVRNSHDSFGGQSGTIATRLRSEVNSASENSLRSSRSSMASTNGRQSQRVEAIWQEANSVVNEGKKDSEVFRLTGDRKADADIMAFMKARQSLLKQRDSSKR